MTTQELRLGNWILPDKTDIPMRVVNLGTDYLYLDFEGNEGDVWEPDMKKICGIPLTEELLLKCGFELRIDSPLRTSYILYEPDIEYTFPKTNTNYKLGLLFGNRHFNILCIHQLQNLYFTLTGEELEINL